MPQSKPQTYDRRQILSAIASGLCLGCSADAAPEPEPRYDTPGAFVARESAPGRFELFHMMFSLQPGDGARWLFMLEYGADLSSLDAARQRARDLPPDAQGVVASVAEEQFVSVPVQVVWFRTPTDAERDAIS